MEKTFEAKWKRGMIAQAKNQVPTLSPAHDLKCARCKLKEGTYVATFKERNFHTDLKCTWKSNGPNLLTPIASNKNRQKSNKNLKVMTRATKAQLPK